jgi:hypothetical protein
VLYLEGGSPDRAILEFMHARACEPQLKLALGTIWPRPQVFHIPATVENLTDLAAVFGNHATPRFASIFTRTVSRRLFCNGTTLFLMTRSTFARHSGIASQDVLYGVCLFVRAGYGWRVAEGNPGSPKRISEASGYALRDRWVIMNAGSTGRSRHILPVC